MNYLYLYEMLASVFGGSAALAPTYRSRRPTGSALRNPSDPVQAARIAAAVAKRERRAQTLQHHAAYSARNNEAWFTDGAMPGRLNPFNFIR